MQLFVLVGFDSDWTIRKFGPTSEDPALLSRYDERWPIGVVHEAVLPVMPGGLLRVSVREVEKAKGRASGEVECDGYPGCVKG